MAYNQKARNYGRKRRKRKSPVGLMVLLTIFVSTILIFQLFMIAKNNSELTANSEGIEYGTNKKFVQSLLPIAKDLHERYGILPSISIGQAILESDWGKSELASKYHNLFGMKASEGDDQVYLKTKEFTNGKWEEVVASFKVYPDWKASMEDHVKLFVSGVSWDPNLYKAVLNAPNYRVAAQALQQAGYATDPDYASKIIDIIETYSLYDYDPVQ